MIGASGETDNFTFIIGFSAGGVLIASLIGIWIKYRYDKRREGK